MSQERNVADSLFLVLDPDLREALAALMEVADLHQRRPQLNRAFDHADDVVHDAQQVLLEEVRLEPVERLFEVRREQAQCFGPLRVALDLGRLHRPPVQRYDLPQDLLGVLGRHLALIVERDAQLV